MKHIKENILIYISLGLSTLVFIIPYLIDSAGFIEEIETSPTSNIALNILLFILMFILLAFLLFIVLLMCYGIFLAFYQLYTNHKRSKAKAEDSIFAAIRLNNIRALNDHISSGIDLNTINEDGSTPLHRAIEGDLNAERKTVNLEIIRLLIDKGADVNVKDDNENTPLHLSTNKNIAELLISNGADVNAKDWSGETPLHRIISNEDLQLDIIKLLIEKGADVNAKDEDDSTPLHIAGDCSVDLKIIKLLISSGANADSKDCSGETPLHKIILNEDGDIIAFLISSGIGLNIKNNKGKTPLDLISSNELKVAAAKAILFGERGGKTREEIGQYVRKILSNYTSLQEARKEKAKEPQYDPNIPDPTKPWCLKCKAHTAYKEVYRARENNSGRQLHRYCKSCEEKVWVPVFSKVKKFFLYYLAPVMFCLPFVVAPIVFMIKIAYDIYLNKWEDGAWMAVYIYAFLLFSLTFGILAVVTLRKAQRAVRYRESKWRKWALEQGYIED